MFKIKEKQFLANRDTSNPHNSLLVKKNMKNKNIRPSGKEKSIEKIRKYFWQMIDTTQAAWLIRIYFYFNKANMVT